MSVVGLRVEDRLTGAGNWSPWKARIVLILKELELWDIVENPVVPPTDAELLTEFRKRNIKALNGFSKPWESFVRGIVAREHMPSWERL
jgi:hypothetical protein